jgi:hypothetical protein
MKRSTATLQERLKGWHDWDTAAFEVGVCLGLWGDFGAPPGEDPWFGTKHIFWTDNPLGNTLHNFLLGLVKAGMLETNEDSLKFRWNPNFKEEDITT